MSELDMYLARLAVGGLMIVVVMGRMLWEVQAKRYSKGLGLTVMMITLGAGLIIAFAQ